MAIATLSIDVEARLANLEAGLKKAVGLADRAGSQLNAAFSAAGAVVMTAAVAGAVQQLTTLVSDTVEVTGAMKDMQESFGATADGLSQIRAGAALGGKSISDMEGPINKLTEALSAAQDVTSDEAQAFKALGLDAEKLKSMAPDEVFIAVANASQNYADGVGKAAVMTALFGKEGAKLIPTMNDIAEVGGNYVKITQAQIDAADEFDKSVKRLAAGFADFKVATGNDVIPALNEIIDFTRRAQKEFGTFSGMLIGGVGGSGAKLLGIDLDELKRAETDVSESFTRLAKARQELGDKKALKAKGLRLGFVVDNNIKSAEEDVAKYSKALKLAIKDRDALVADRKNGGAQKKAVPDFAPAGTKPTKDKPDKPEKINLNLGEDIAAGKAYADAMEGIGRAQQSADSVGRTLTESQKALFGVMASPEWDRMPDAWRNLLIEQTAVTVESENAAAQIKRLNDLLANTESSRLEKARDDMQLLAKAFEDGRITAEQFQEAATASLGLVAETGKDQIDELKQAIDGWGKDSAKTIASAMLDGKASFKDFGDYAKKILSDVLAMQIHKNVTGPATEALGKVNWSAMFGFADGGIMTSAGPLPLRAYENGGVANSPQVALFGEGRMNEAFVPLPDGRSIPVTVKGGGAGITSVKVEVINETSQPARAVSATPTFDMAGMVVRVVLRDLSNNGPIRQAMGN